MKKKQKEDQLRAYLSGKENEEGEQLFLEWYNSFDDKKPLPEKWNKTQLKKEMFHQLKNQMDKERAKSRKFDQTKLRLTLSRKNWLGAAAVLALLVVSGFVLKMYLQPQELIYQTAFGETERLHLPDGTEVVLNAASSLKYLDNNPRKVWLDGEAFFKVSKKPATGAKFKVITDNLDVVVLGTTFNVNSRNDITKVVLEEGKVKLKLKNGVQKEMKPGDLLAFSSKLNKILENKQTVKAELHTSWKDGSLLFDKTPLLEAMKKVEETYGFEIVFVDELSAIKTISGGVPNKNLDMCLKMIEKSAGVTINKQDKKLMVRLKTLE